MQIQRGNLLGVGGNSGDSIIDTSRASSKAKLSKDGKNGAKNLVLPAQRGVREWCVDAKTKKPEKTFPKNRETSHTTTRPNKAGLIAQRLVKRKKGRQLI